MDVTARIFGFERDFAEDLGLMPLAVRYRLDLAGVKLGLQAWRALPRDMRGKLLAFPIGGAAGLEGFRTCLVEACARHGAEPPADLPAADPAAWSAAAGPPAAAEGPLLAGPDWSRLDDLQRYALAKLARSRREPDALSRALREFLGAG